MLTRDDLHARGVYRTKYTAGGRDRLVAVASDGALVAELYPPPGVDVFDAFAMLGALLDRIDPLPAVAEREALYAVTRATDCIPDRLRGPLALLGQRLGPPLAPSRLARVTERDARRPRPTLAVVRS